MSRTCSRVHAAHRRSTPRSELDSDQPGGRPSPPASSPSTVPHRLHVATAGTVAMTASAPMTDDLVQQLLDAQGATANRDVLRDILRTAAGLAGDGADRLALTITRAALQEMRGAFALFAPYQDTPKVTIFGSARTSPADPLY